MAQRLQFAVIGLGPFSRTICKALVEFGHEVLAVDPRPDVVQEVHDQGLATQAVAANPERLSSLAELEVAQFDAVVVGRGTDVEASLLTVLNLLQLGARKIVAKAVHERHEELLLRLGGDRLRVIYPERDMGLRLALQLTGQDLMEAVWVDPHHAFAEHPLPAELIGVTPAEARLRARKGVVLVGIRRSGQLQLAPPDHLRFEAGDRLVLLGRNEDLAAFG